MQTSWPRTDQVDQPRLHRWRVPTWQWCACSTKAKLKKNEKPTPIEVPEFCCMAKWHPSLYLQYVSWPVYLPAHCVMPVHSFHGEYGMKTPFLNHHRSAGHKWSLALVEVPSMLTLWWIFGWGKWTKGYLVWVQLPHWENQRTTLHRGPMSVWVVQPWRQCTWENNEVALKKKPGTQY